MSSEIDPAPPAGEEIHLPEPTLLPVFVAVGLTVFLVGLTTNIALVVAGAVVLLVAIAKWIALVRRDVDELPLEHH